MKDLYRRNKLAPRETDRIKIHNCEGSEADKEAAFSILLNPDKKAEYDRAHLALSNIGYLRRHLGLAGKSNWRLQHGDFLQPMDSSTAGRSGTRPRRKAARGRWRRLRSPRWMPLVRRVKNLKLSWILSWPVVIAVLLSLLPLGYFAWQDSRPAPVLRSAPDFDERMHSMREGTPVFATPDVDAVRLSRLAEFQEVSVDPQYSDEDWAYVDVDGQLRGYVQKRFLAVGSGELAQIEKCRQYGSWRPESGQQLAAGRTARQRLHAINPSARDALVKLKDHAGETQVFFYLRAGEEVELSTVPRGRFQLQFALGDNYSPACARFLDNMQAQRSTRYITFSDEGGGRVSIQLGSADQALGFAPIANQAF